MSTSIAIKVENLSKAYQLGQIGTGTISRDLERWYARIRGKEDPFLRIGESNNQNTKSESGIVWSLKDVNFEIEQGDAVGIIGRNGAGKSTLLKILSKVTAPTTGKISGKGRIASLLEVGTGFHPELSGRENIFLNGAILGMRKKEIQRKFDEIVDFAGIERYIDTPVKRYSSGMYVRLAFAVAAHLESEILIVDEVLAVGDAEFQKKCLGKMGEVSKGEGRTVLFVSHNMMALSSFCNTGLILENGKLIHESDINSAIKLYYDKSSNLKKMTYHWPTDILQNGLVRFEHISISKLENDNNGIITINNNIEIAITLTILIAETNIAISVEVNNQQGLCIFKLTSQSVFSSGRYIASFIIPSNLLNDGIYIADVYVIKDRRIVEKEYKEIISFEVKETERTENWFDKWVGVIRPSIPFILNKI